MDSPPHTAPAPIAPSRPISARPALSLAAAQPPPTPEEEEACIIEFDQITTPSTPPATRGLSVNGTLISRDGGGARGFSVTSQGARVYQEDAAGGDYPAAGPFEWTVVLADGHSNKVLSSRITTAGDEFSIADRAVAAVARAPDNVHAAVISAFEALDRDLEGHPVAARGGSTCVFAGRLRDSGDIVAANVGDSAAVVIFADGTGEMITRLHRPTEPAEAERLAAISAEKRTAVVYAGRIGGCLAVSRAFADFGLKGESLAGAVIATPTVRTLSAAELQARGATTLILMSDGVIDGEARGPAGEFADFARRVAAARSRDGDPRAVANFVVEHALSVNSFHADNTTAFVIELGALGLRGTKTAGGFLNLGGPRDNVPPLDGGVKEEREGLARADADAAVDALNGDVGGSRADLVGGEDVGGV